MASMIGRRKNAISEITNVIKISKFIDSQRCATPDVMKILQIHFCHIEDVSSDFILLLSVVLCKSYYRMFFDHKILSAACNLHIQFLYL